MIGLSRFVLGAHGANQILYGFLIGLWSILFCIYKVDPEVETFIANLKLNQFKSSDQLLNVYLLSAGALAVQVLAYFWVDA